jgi:hypothetical protein
VSIAGLRSVERLHAVVAWAATIALGVTAWLCVRKQGTRRAVRVAGATAVGLVLAAGGLGLALHDPYRARLRQRLFLGSLELGWLFERKQNAAFGAMLLGVSALATLEQLERSAAGGPGTRELRRSAALAWVASAVLALAASIASAIVARRAHF